MGVSRARFRFCRTEEDGLERRNAPGLFKGERTFQLTPLASGDVEFSMREVYSGLMAPLIFKSIPNLQPAFEEFASDLKRAAEAKAASTR